MDREKVLKGLGLNSAERKTYLELLSAGQAKSSIIALKAGLNRGATYYALQALKQRGFVSEVVKSGVRHYSPAPPERLLELAEEESTRKLNALRESLTTLQSIRGTSIEKPLVEMYEGYEGFKTIFNVLLDKASGDLRCLMSPSVLQYLPHFHEQFRKRRLAKRIPIRTITQRTVELERIRGLDKKELRETRFSQRQLFTGTDVLLYILKDGIISIKSNTEQQLGVYIQDASLALLHKNIFEELWRDAQ